MKKYIVPELQIVEMETTQVIATSLTLYSDSDETTTIQLEGRKRGADWESYYDN